MTMSTSHPGAVKIWSTLLEKSVYQASYFLDSPLVKKVQPGSAIPDDAVIVQMDTFRPASNAQTKGAGWYATFDLEGPLFGYPTAGDNVIANFNRLSLFTDSIQINQDRLSVQNEGKFADGLVPFEFLDRVRERLTDEFWPQYFDERFVAKASGSLGANTYQTIDATKATASARNVNGSAASDGNDLRAPGSTRWIVGNARGAANALTSSDGMSLDLADLLVLQAVRPAKNSTLKRGVPLLKIKGRPAIVIAIDYRASQSMNANTSGRFYDQQRARLQGGGKYTDIADWAAYMYPSPMGVDVYFVTHPAMVGFTTYGASSNLNAVRCLGLGKAALRCAPGRESKDVGSFSWHQREGDEGNQIVVTTGWTGGVTKPAYNTTETGSTREDYAIIALDVFVQTA